MKLTFRKKRRRKEKESFQGKRSRVTEVLLLII